MQIVIQRIGWYFSDEFEYNTTTIVYPLIERLSKIFGELCSFNHSFNNHLIMHINKQIHPMYNMFQFTVIFSAGKIIIKTFGSIFQILDSPFNNASFS
jgi:hypothetical protein